MGQLEAAEEAVEELRRAGRLGLGSAALVAAVLGLAEQVDMEPTAALWREYRLALAALLAPSEEDSPIDALLAELAGPSPTVRDAEAS